MSADFHKSSFRAFALSVVIFVNIFGESIVRAQVIGFEPNAVAGSSLVLPADVNAPIDANELAKQAPAIIADVNVAEVRPVVPAVEDSNRYLNVVIEFADNVLKYGRDTYGPKHTPLFVDGLNIHTHEPVKWIAPNGDRWILSNLASQQTLFRTLDGLTRITGDHKYKQAAMDAIKYAFENLRSPNGLLYWGDVSAYDTQADKVLSYRGHHTFKLIYPYYELMWEVNPQATKEYIEAFWSGHILNWSNLDMNRICYDMNKPLDKPWDYEFKGGPVPFKSSRGIGMITTGTSLAYAAALLSHLSSQEQPLVWSKRLIKRYVETRDPRIGISAYAFNSVNFDCRTFPLYPFGYRWLDYPEDRQVHPWLSVMLIGMMLGVDGNDFKQWALEELTAWGKVSYRRSDNSFLPICIDGTSLEGYVLKDFPVGLNIAELSPAGPQYFWAYCVAYKATNDGFIWQMIRDIAMGNSYGDIGENLTDAPELSIDTQCSDVYCLLGFLELYTKTNKLEFLQMARRIGDNILEQKFHDGFFVPSKRHVYTRFDCFEPLALLHLYAELRPKPKSVPTVWPSLSLFRGPYRYKEDGVDLLTIYTLTDSTEPPYSLQEAAAIGNIDLVKSLVDKGTDVDGWDDNNRKTALDRAVISGHKEVVEFLIKAGARINIKSSITAPLHYAVEYDHKDVVQLLCDYGADINVKDGFGQTPLDMAANKGYKDITELLISKGADVNATDNRGDTLLHRAVERNQKDLVALLIDAGADMSIQNNAAETPLRAAVRREDKDIVDLLINKGADVNTINNRGEAVLHRTVRFGRKDMTEFLIDKGADVNIKNKNGQTPLDIAIERGRTEIIEILRKHGAKEDGEEKKQESSPAPQEDKQTDPNAVERNESDAVNP